MGCGLLPQAQERGSACTWSKHRPAKRSGGLCLPAPCPSGLWSSADFEALSRPCPSFLEGEGAAAEGSRGGLEAQPLLVACPWYFSPGQEARTSCISLPRTPGHLLSQSPWDLFVFGLGLFVLHTHPPHPPTQLILGPLDPVLLSGPDLWESSGESDL